MFSFLSHLVSLLVSSCNVRNQALRKIAFSGFFGAVLVVFLLFHSSAAGMINVNQ